MSARKRAQKIFPWRETFLAALTREPQVKLAHLRKDTRFRRQWEHALDQGRDAAYRLHLKRLAADPQYLRALERLRSYFGSEGKPFLILKSLIC
jgi:hypothetical protein